MHEADFCSLPEDCISSILSLATPRDVCHCSLVSWPMRSIADSNIIWENFLPSDYERLLSSSVSQVPFSTKKELYFRLCDSILIDKGKKMFSLEKSTGKICYMLSARDLSIAWGNYPLYWCWKSSPQSRFSEVAELRSVCWLEIHGKINASMLSPRTTYGAYLIVKFADRAYGLDLIPSQISVQVGDCTCLGTAYLRVQESQKQKLEHLYFLNRVQALRSRVINEGNERVPQQREDGWMEIELGEFFIDGGNEGDVKMSLKEIKGEHLKGGLIIEGIEVRPKKG